MRDFLTLATFNLAKAIAKSPHFLTYCQSWIFLLEYFYSSKYDSEFKHAALKISEEGLDVSLLSSYKKYKSTNKNSQLLEVLTCVSIFLKNIKIFQIFSYFGKGNSRYCLVPGTGTFATHNCQGHNDIQFFCNAKKM